MKKKSLGIVDVVILALSAVFFIGMLTFLKPCGPKEDGSFMSCHWSGQALIGVSALLMVQSVLLAAVRSSSVKKGIALSMIPAGILAAAIPGRLIHHCMMNTMQCNLVTKPGATVFGIVIAVLALADVLLLGRAERQER